MSDVCVAALIEAAAHGWLSPATVARVTRLARAFAAAAHAHRARIWPALAARLWRPQYLQPALYDYDYRALVHDRNARAVRRARAALLRGSR